MAAGLPMHIAMEHKGLLPFGRNNPLKSRGAISHLTDTYNP